MHVPVPMLEEMPCRARPAGSILHSFTCALSDTVFRPGARCANEERAEIEAADRYANEEFMIGRVIAVLDRSVPKYRVTFEHGGSRADIHRRWRGVFTFVARYDVSRERELRSGPLAARDPSLGLRILRAAMAQR